MARNYNEMSDEELRALKQAINHELAQRGQTSKRTQFFDEADRQRPIANRR